MKKKFLFSFIIAALVGCSSIAQVEGTSNNATIEKVTLIDSVDVYYVTWKGHVYIYST